jgi:hypothetical protein
MSGYDIFAWIVLLILVASAIGVFCIVGETRRPAAWSALGFSP